MDAVIGLLKSFGVAAMVYVAYIKGAAKERAATTQQQTSKGLDDAEKALKANDATRSATDAELIDRVYGTD